MCPHRDNLWSLFISGSNLNGRIGAFLDDLPDLPTINFLLSKDIERNAIPKRLTDDVEQQALMTDQFHGAEAPHNPCEVWTMDYPGPFIRDTSIFRLVLCLLKALYKKCTPPISPCSRLVHVPYSVSLINGPECVPTWLRNKWTTRSFPVLPYYLRRRQAGLEETKNKLDFGKAQTAISEAILGNNHRRS